MSAAPIALFCYKRPGHTLRTLESLRDNSLVGSSHLHIFCDGPGPGMTDEGKANLEEVRRIAREFNWPGDKQIIEQQSNKGLARSIIDGVTELIRQYGRVIVVEDDLEISPGFLQYMNDALDYYADVDQVMHISGYMFPVRASLPETFFYQATSCWGWATWRRAWDKLNTDSEKLYVQLRERGLLERFNLDGSTDFAIQLDANRRGLLNTWAIKWQASVMLAGGLCLHPGRSLVRNHGFGEGSTNTGSGFELFNSSELAEHVGVKPIELRESEEAREAMIEYYNSSRGAVRRFMYNNYTGSAIIRYIFMTYMRLFR